MEACVGVTGMLLQDTRGHGVAQLDADKESATDELKFLELENVVHELEFVGPIDEEEGQAEKDD